MPTRGITDAHERLQPVSDPSPHWSDSLYFNAWDPGSGTFLMTRIAVLGNQRRGTAGMIVWIGDEVAYGYGREVDEIPSGDWDVMTVDGLTYRMLESGQAWAVQLDDGATRAHLEWRGLSAATSYDEHPSGPLPRAVGWGHYEQTCRVTGDLVVEGRRIPVDGFGQRDHSWGYRHWAGLHQWHWVTGFLSDGRSFNLFEVQAHDGTTTINGFVHSPDGDDYITKADRVLERDAHGGAVRYRATFTTAGGSALTVSGERAATAVPVRPAQDQTAIVVETPMRLSAEGATGFGIYEHLVTEFD